MKEHQQHQTLPLLHPLCTEQSLLCQSEGRTMLPVSSMSQDGEIPAGCAFCIQRMTKSNTSYWDVQGAWQRWGLGNSLTVGLFLLDRISKSRFLGKMQVSLSISSLEVAEFARKILYEREMNLFTTLKQWIAGMNFQFHFMLTLSISSLSLNVTCHWYETTDYWLKHCEKWGDFFSHGDMPSILKVL